MVGDEALADIEGNHIWMVRILGKCDLARFLLKPGNVKMEVQS
jgi:hypothetical protein